MVEVAGIIKIVPRRVWVEKDLMGTVHIKMQHEGHDEFDFIQIQYDHRHTSNAHQATLTDAILKLLGVSVTDVPTSQGQCLNTPGQSDGNTHNVTRR
jgi:hypothetical protein